MGKITDIKPEKKTSAGFDFIGRGWMAYLFSGLLFALGLIGLIKNGGVGWSIDFTGGTVVQFSFSKAVSLPELRELLKPLGWGTVNIQEFVGTHSFALRLPVMENSEKVTARIRDTLKLHDQNLVMERVEMVGPVVGKFLVKLATKAFFFSFLGIMVYVGIRFKGTVWGLAGILALVHDVVITFGIMNFLGREISLVVVSALLTLAGYSINDTIVVYDRIREYLRLRGSGKNVKETFNESIQAVLPRTVITSMTTVFVTIALLIFGGEVIRDFSLALSLGIILGTYSSIFIASPIVYAWKFKTRSGGGKG